MTLPYKVVFSSMVQPTGRMHELFKKEQQKTRNPYIIKLKIRKHAISVFLKPIDSYIPSVVNRFPARVHLGPVAGRKPRIHKLALGQKIGDGASFSLSTMSELDLSIHVG